MKKKIDTETVRNTAILLTAAALVFTVLVRFVNVQPIGPNGSEVGFASVNKAAAEAIGVSIFWYEISQTLGILAILVCVFFAALGAYQLIREKSIRKVDRRILALGGLYAVTVFLYVLFDKLAINYRPVLENGVLEPSYPSSHTMLSLVAFGSVFLLVRRFFAEAKPRRIIGAAALVLLVLTVLSRLLSGFHWLTDIIGGILIAAALLAWFAWLLDRPKKRRNKKA
ncbi:MAG: phosphatase PAP2 family protein [Lachnospiraceae bacterium]|nr:phosphatase PAP2 family protein [Lachnospiraceae bacterium]